MQHNRSGEQDPNRASEMEQAEGSRETVEQGGHDDTVRDRGPRSGGQDRGTGGGITNRDLEREQAEQDHLPPRGSEREE